MGLPEGPQGPVVLLTVAQLSPYKGHDVMLEALPAVLRRQPRVHAVFAGDGGQRAALESRARELGLAAHVHFLGYRDDIPDLMAAADLFVLPSRHTEGLPMAPIEAMFVACPVVTTAAGGIPDLTGEQGGDRRPIVWTVPANDPPALAAAVCEAIEDDALRTDRVEGARKRVLERFTAERMVEATLAVYREALNARAGEA